MPLLQTPTEGEQNVAVTPVLSWSPSAGDWTVEGVTYPAGSLVSVGLSASVRTGTPTDVELILVPTDRMSIQGVSESEGASYVRVLDEVTGSLLRLTRPDSIWRLEPVDLPANGSLSVTSSDPFSDVVMVNFESFTVPDRLYLLREGSAPRVIKSLPERFDASGFVTEQRFATSADGERIPYFVVRPENLPMDGTAPTLLYGYGGFEVSLTPSYASPGTIAWLERGGVYVLANIRGGGEFGPSWHEAALLENRQRAFDDFIAVAEDLVSSGITSPEHLGISGGSNGGLLVGAVTMQRPDLFGAVVCAVPLLDMLRYHKLLAGASWMAEYGNPDEPEARAFITDVAAMGVRKLVVSGGEPLVRKDLPELLEHAARLGLQLGLVTNSFALPQLWPRLRHLPIYLLFTSL
ncbi:MAG: prolyl oligopeptidase family serine peptidase, partial [Gemmatimonadota bacterium]